MIAGTVLLGMLDSKEPNYSSRAISCTKMYLATGAIALKVYNKYFELEPMNVTEYNALHTVLCTLTHIKQNKRWVGFH